MSGQSAEMACPQPGLLATVPRTPPARGRAEPPTAARSGPKTAPFLSCKQQLSFRLKAFRRRHLAAGRRTPESCKQQLSSGTSLDFGSTSAPQAPAVGILQTTTSWRADGFCRITEVEPCSPPIRSMTFIACTRKCCSFKPASTIEWVPHPRRCYPCQNRGKCGRFIPGLTRCSVMRKSHCNEQ